MSVDISPYLHLLFWLTRDDVVCRDVLGEEITVNPTVDLSHVEKIVEEIALWGCKFCKTSWKAHRCANTEKSLMFVWNKADGFDVPVIAMIVANAQQPALEEVPQLHTPKANVDVVRATLARRYKPGQIIELRVPQVTVNDKRVVMGGFYTDHERLIEDVAYLIKQTDAPAIYTGLQEIKGGDERLAVVTNTLKQVFSREGANDDDIASYRWLLFDVDTIRAKEFVHSSSTDGEKAAALGVLNRLIEYFGDLGFAGDVIDSGNSYHLVFPIDLPASAETEELIKAVLASVSAKFTTAKAKVDTSVYDRPRICKLPGTPARKGLDTPERPHRWSSVLSEVQEPKIIPFEILLQIANLTEMPQPVQQAQATSEEIRKSMNWVLGFLDWAGLEYGDEKPYKGGIIVPILSDCPFDHDGGHHKNECHAGVNAEGKYCFACKHDSCAGIDWKKFRAKVQKDKGEAYIGDSVIIGTPLPAQPSHEQSSEEATEQESSESDSGDEQPTAVPATEAEPSATDGDFSNLMSVLQGELILTENGVAELFNKLFGDDYLYAVVRREGEWMRWTGQIWIATTFGAMRKKATQMAKAVRKLLPAVQTEAERNALRSLANKCDRVSFLTNAFKFLEGERETQFQDFDRKPHLFNFVNGTFDLDRLEFRPFAKDDLLTQMAGVAYRPDAACPMFLKFLENSFPSPAIREYLQRWFGYCMTGTGIEKSAPFFHGLGDNGKTILLDVMMSIFGYKGDNGYGRFCEWDTFAENKFGGLAIRNDLARLHNARLVVCDEGSKMLVLNEGIFKKVTGNSAITCRYLNKEFFTYVAGFKLMMATNNRPEIKGNDKATWNRVHYIPMHRKFPVGSPDRIENLLALLMAEREGIAAWMVEGYKKYRLAGGLLPPSEILEATAEYQAHSDIQGEFFTDECVRGEGLSVKMDDLFNRHKYWSTKVHEQALTMQNFTEVVKSRGFKVARRESEHGRPNYAYGLALQAPQNGQGTVILDGHSGGSF